MATIVTFKASGDALIEIDPSNHRIRQVTEFSDSHAKWMDGRWVQYLSTAQPIRPGHVVQFKGCYLESDPAESWSASFWGIEDFVGVRTEPDPLTFPPTGSSISEWKSYFQDLYARHRDVVPEPELEDLVGPMRSDVIIRGAAELAASIFVQQGWADEFDAEELEGRFHELVDFVDDDEWDKIPTFGIFGAHPKFAAIIGDKAIAFCLVLDEIVREDLETEA